ncbi:kinase-like domain-containing protein [Blastocladiella britannica]|nr:kinase-like domain-containing protein [Blastocladiella britannica]
MTTKKTQQIATLWAGYGTLHRVTDHGTTIVVKSIDLTSASPTTDRPTLSHARKVASYHVEHRFYEHQTRRVPTQKDLEVPNDPAITFPDASYASLTLALTDLAPEYPESFPGTLPVSQARAALRWLAAFHAHHWVVRDKQSLPVPDTWPQGTYWYLATRAAELRDIGRGSRWSWLADGAHRWAGQLNAWSVTQVHGDAKAANFLFGCRQNKADPTVPPPTAAAVDFQYTGAGCPMSDVVYLVATSVDPEFLDGANGGLPALVVEDYISPLCDALRARGIEPPTSDTLQEWFEVALLDWARFMAGWGWWGNVRWVQQFASDLQGKHSGP